MPTFNAKDALKTAIQMFETAVNLLQVHIANTYSQV